jgi:hypothetical protein
MFVKGMVIVLTKVSLKTYSTNVYCKRATEQDQKDLALKKQRLVPF